MNPEFNISDVTFFTQDGTQFLTMQPINIKYSPSPEDKLLNNGDDLRFYNKEYSGTLENIQIDPNFKDSLLDKNRNYTIIGKGYRFPRGNKLPKKKRIRKKWMKKYAYDFELENCRLV